VNAAAGALLAAGTLFVVAMLADGASSTAMASGVSSRLLPALLVNAGAATVARLEGAITRSGAIGGALIGTTIYLGAGWEGWAMLVATFACALIASYAGWDRKKALGIAQDDEGARSARHAVANCGVAAAAAVVGATSPYQSAAWLALVTALTAGGADTVASEVGKAWGRRTVSIVGLQPVQPGTPGAISPEGVIANIVAAIVLAGLGAALGLIAGAAIPIVVVGALLGASVESVLGATLEPAGILNNDLLNYINTAAAAALAIYLI
jgi:uncharacterized protein (TIGR00297 family)